MDLEICRQIIARQRGKNLLRVFYSSDAVSVVFQQLLEVVHSNSTVLPQVNCPKSTAMIWVDLCQSTGIISASRVTVMLSPTLY